MREYLAKDEPFDPEAGHALGVVVATNAVLEAMVEKRVVEFWCHSNHAKYTEDGQQTVPQPK